MFYFYVIECQSTGKRYKGHTADLATRLKQHNGGKTKSTRHAGPWLVRYTESFSSRAEAVAREQYYKTYAGGRELSARLESGLAGRSQRI